MQQHIHSECLDVKQYFSPNYAQSITFEPELITNSIFDGKLCSQRAGYRDAFSTKSYLVTGYVHNLEELCASLQLTRLQSRPTLRSILVSISGTRQATENRESDVIPNTKNSIYLFRSTLRFF